MEYSSVNTPLVSVIIPVYNMEKYVEQALSSVCRQTLKNIEIIVINDGSTDNSKEIITKIACKDKRICIINKKNGGLASAYNEGQRIAKGKYIYFLDSDDWLEDDCLGIMYKIAEKTQAEIVKSFGYITENKGYSQEVITIPPHKCDKIITNMITIPEFVSRHVAQWTCLYSRNFLMKNNIWSPECPKNMAPDIDFMFHIWCKCKKLYIIRKAFVHYRLDNNNSDKNSGAKMSFYLIRGHLVARATMVKLYLPNAFWYIKTRTEFEHFMYELITYRCNTNRWCYIKVISKIFRENIKHGLVNLKGYSLKHRITYRIIAELPWLYWLNSVLKIYNEILNRHTGARTLCIFGGIYKYSEEKNVCKVFLFGYLIKKYEMQQKDYNAYIW